MQFIITICFLSTACFMPLAKTTIVQKQLNCTLFNLVDQHWSWVMCFLTSVCTMCGLCSLRLFTVWKTSRMPSAFTRSRTVLRAQNVPVRPAPALLTHKHQLLTALWILMSLFLLFLIGWPWIPTGLCSSIGFIITECFGDVTMDRFLVKSYQAPMDAFQHYKNH